MKIIKHTENEIHIQGTERILKYWKHGVGLIPLHFKPKLDEDFHLRSQLKHFLREHNISKPIK